MKTRLPETTLMGHWPLFTCIMIVLITPIFLVVKPQEIQETAEPRVEIVNAFPVDEPDSQQEMTPEKERPSVETRDAVVPEEMGQPDPAPEQDIQSQGPSQLKIQTADWRYVGSIISADRSVALIERMEFPDKKSHVALGESLEGITVDDIEPSSIRLSLDGENRDLMLTQGPAFETDDILIPEEVVEDPEILAAVVFAQTLGKYVAAEPDFSSVETEVEPAGETLHEMMDALSGIGNLVPPIEGESIEDWGDAAAEEMSANPDESLDPSEYPLTEEDSTLAIRIRSFDGAMTLASDCFFLDDL